MPYIIAWPWPEQIWEEWGRWHCPSVCIWLACSTDPKSFDCCLVGAQGTNGGVTWTGFAASLAGGLLVGVVFWSMGAISPRLYTVPFQQEPAIGQWSLVILGTHTL